MTKIILQPKRTVTDSVNIIESAAPITVNDPSAISVPAGGAYSCINSVKSYGIEKRFTDEYWASTITPFSNGTLIDPYLATYDGTKWSVSWSGSGAVYFEVVGDWTDGYRPIYAKVSITKISTFGISSARAYSRPSTRTSFKTSAIGNASWGSVIYFPIYNVDDEAADLDVDNDLRVFMLSANDATVDFTIDDLQFVDSL